MEKDLGSFGRIGVLMGGPSSERQISLKSGQAVFQALKEKGLSAVAIDIRTDDGQEARELLKQANIDIAFIALHGHFGEDGQIQAILEEMNIPYTGSDSSASRLAMDKVMSRRIFQEQALRVPDYIVLSDDKEERSQAFRLIRNLSSPYVVKPAAQGSSIGLTMVRTERELSLALDNAFAFGSQVIVEEYIQGREITVGILGDSALPVVEIIPENEFYDYEAKYEPGKSNYIVPADLPAEVSTGVQKQALRAHSLLGCWGFSRVDMRLNPAKLCFILEVNSIPGLTSTSLLPKAAGAAGIDFTQLCIRILDFACERALKKGG